MNLAIRGIEADLGKYNADTFFNDCHPQLKADFILANPPFNLSGWGQERLLGDVRWKYGTPPAGNANFAWLQHMIWHLAPNGPAARAKSAKTSSRTIWWTVSSPCRPNSSTPHKSQSPSGS